MRRVTETIGVLLAGSGYILLQMGGIDGILTKLDRSDGTVERRYNTGTDPWSIPDPATEELKAQQAIQSSRFFKNCDAARRAGVAPIRIGEPGYRDILDGDGDGIACEPYRGQWRPS